jgi:transposase
MVEATFELLLKLPHIRVIRVEQTNAGAYSVTVEGTLQHTTCHRCKRRTATFYRLDDWIMLQHLPICGSKVFIRLQPKRFRCPFCSDGPTTTQELPWYRPRSQFTKAYEDYLLMQCVNSTVKDVSSKEHVGYAAIEGIIDHYVQTTIDWSTYTTLDILGIDEIALRKGHRSYIVIITTRMRNGTVQLLAVLPDRTKATVLTFFRSIPYRLRRTVTDVCSDMYEAYLTAIEEIFGADISVIDRFHVAQHYYDAADSLRKEEMARLKRERKKREYDLLKGVMWSFRRRPTDITVEDQEVLECLFSAAPRLRQAYAFREALTSIFETPYTKIEAIEHLQQWITTVEKSGLTCFDGFLKLMTQHMNGIANYFRDRYTSGFVEGFNNRIKVLKRRCYGIFNLKHVFQRITLDLSGYTVFGVHPSPTK